MSPTCNRKMGYIQIHCMIYDNYSASSHYLNKCWVIVNWILWNKLWWNFIHENDLKISSAKWGGGGGGLKGQMLWCHIEIEICVCNANSEVEYSISRNNCTRFFSVLCFVVILTILSGFLGSIYHYCHWYIYIYIYIIYIYCGCHTIVPVLVPVKKFRRI